LPRKDRERTIKLIMEALGVARDVAVALATSHPVVMGLAIMSGVAMLSLVVEGEKAESILGGLYADARTLATVSAAAPYVVGGLNLVSGVLAQKTSS